MPKYELPELPYDYSALEPHLSGEILELHHGKHHQAYVDGANTTFEKLGEARSSGDFGTINQLEKNMAFHLSGHVLHSLFWTNMSPDGGGEPDGELAAAVTEYFGSFDAFRAQLTEAAMNVQGSGWGALSWEPMAGRSDRRAGLRPPGQRRSGRPATPRARHVGARVLPPVQEREEGLGGRVLEPGQLARRRCAIRPREVARARLKFAAPDEQASSGPVRIACAQQRLSCRRT